VQPATSNTAANVAPTVEAGTAAGIDGDSLVLNGAEHRLFGIDAVEADQRCIKQQVQWACGQAAARMLQSLIKGQRVVCEWSSKDRYHRRLSTCHVNDVSLNAAMVFAGYAVAYRRYSSAYVEYETAAKEQGSGIWAGEFMLPWDHRKKGPKSSLPVPDATRPIKGNINSKGKRYYHCPDDRSYPKTRISEARGEQWFATAAEAESAGWVRPPRAGECQL